MEEKKRNTALDETYLKLYDQILLHEKNKSQISKQSKIKGFMMTQTYMTTLMSCTIIALFFDDFRHLVAIESTDIIFYGITLVIILFFVIGTL